MTPNELRRLVEVILEELEFAGAAPEEVGELLLCGGEQAFCLAIGWGRKDVYAGNSIGPVELLRGPKFAPVGLKSLVQGSRSEVGCKCVWQAQHSGELRPEEA